MTENSTTTDALVGAGSGAAGLGIAFVSYLGAIPGLFPAVLLAVACLIPLVALAAVIGVVAGPVVLLTRLVRG